MRKRAVLKNFLVRPVAAALVLSLAYAQALFAADPRQMLLDAKRAFEEMDDTRRASTGSSAEQLLASQEQQQNVVNQQNALEELQNLNFNLTTQNGDILNYVGNTLSQVTRPDGTTLINIQQDANGNITNADLKLVDGSIQIYENGQVIGYQTPDGSQVIYSGGQIQKIITKDGIETTYLYPNPNETVLDNLSYQTKYDAQGKLKEVLQKSTGNKTLYSTGIIQKIVYPDGTELNFIKTIQANGDTLVTAPSAVGTYTDLQGNIFSFDSDGNVSQIKLPDNSVLTSVTWDAQNKINNADLTLTDGSKYSYQNKKLVQSWNAQAVSTTYSYTADKIITVSNSVTNEYLLDKTPLKTTWADGSYTLYNQSGTYKGFRDKDITSTGTFTYEYQTVSGVVSVQKREVLGSLYNKTTLQGNTALLSSTNPYSKFNITFADDNSIDQTVTAQATASGKNLTVNLSSGTGSNFSFNNATPVLLGVALQKGVIYNVEIRWESNRVGIYVYDAGTVRPANPQGTISDRSWNPTFQVQATNVTTLLDSSLNGTYTRTASVSDKNDAYQPLSPTEKLNFRFSSGSSSNTVVLNGEQQKVGNVTRKFTITYLSNKWTLVKSDTDSSTGVTTSTTVLVNQTLTSGVDYIAELRIESGKANLYVYNKTAARPSTPTGSLDAFDAATKISVSNIQNAISSGQILKNLSTPTSPSTQASAITSFFETIQNSAISRPASQPGSVDFSTVTYDPSGNLKEILKKDGGKLIFQNGILKQALDPAGNVTSFDFTESSLSNVLGSQIVQNSVTSKYDSTGKLSEVAVSGLTIHYKSDSSAIDFIKKEDGTELHDLVFGANGQITAAVIITPDGEERIYAAGKLVSLKKTDQSVILYSNDKPLKIITPQKLSYSFSYTPALIEAVLDTNGIQTPDSLAAVRMEYDQDFNLKKVIRQNQEVLNYLSDTKLRIDIPGNTSQVIDYVKDGQGNVLSYTTTQGSAKTFYDANNQPIKAIISPTAENPHTLEITYQYGKIRQITKDTVLTFVYTYSFNADNEEITTIEDKEENSTKIYKDGQLLTSFDKVNSVLSTYEYEPDPVIASVGAGGAVAKQSQRVKRVQVTRLGRSLHTYTYSYPADQTVVTDEEGVARTYDANKKLIFLEKENKKYAYTYSLPDSSGNSVTQETLIEQKLSDGSIAHYEDGNVSFIDRADGVKISNIILNSDRSIKSAEALLPDGTKQVFDGSFILKETRTDGKELNYTYDKDAGGNITAIWVAAGGAKIKYDPAGNLQSLKLDGVLTPSEARSATQHVYEGNGIGSNSIDGNFNTAQAHSESRSFGQTQGSVIVSLYSTHIFPEPQAITQILYRILTSGSGWGDYSNNNHASGYYSVEYQQGSSGPWTVFNGAQGGMGDTGQVTKTLNIAGITAIRVFANGYGEGSDHGGATAAASIYEIQYTLADQSTLGFSTLRDAQNQITGYKFNGYPGTIQFDAQGNLLSGTPANLNGPAQFLNQHIPSLATGPYKTGSAALTLQSSWFSTAKSAVFDAGFVWASEYSSDGTLETQSKADGTVTLFDNNKPSKVLDKNGLVLIQYTYDSAGNIQTVYLKNARETLPQEVLKARKTIEGQRASQLEAIAAQQNLAYQSIKTQYDSQRQALETSLSDLQNNFNALSGTKVSGKSAKNQKGDALNQMGHAMEDIRGALTTLETSQANAYAGLSIQVKQVSDQIIADSQTALTALSAQETSLKKEILKQEASPVIYDYYRRILGRDPSQAEYDFWIQKMDYSSGENGAEASVLVTLPSNTDPATLAFNESGGVVSAESESAHVIAAGTNGRVWQSASSTSYSGNTAFIAQGASNYSSTNINADSPRMDFNIHFNTPGTYTLWVRGFATDGVSDSFHAGLDGVISSTTLGYNFCGFTFGQMAWSKKNINGATVKFTVTSAGDHTLSFWMREAGFKFDKFILTQDTSFTPSGVSTSESGRVAPPPTQPVSQKITTALTGHLNALPELSERQAYVQHVKTAVTTLVNQYLAKSQADKEAYAASLGLASTDLIALSASDAQKILTWLNSRSLHFGQSAFLSLESLLDQTVIASPGGAWQSRPEQREELAQKAIMTDILTGVISPLDDGDLVISMFALNKVAQGYGLSLSGANLTWEDLQTLYQTSPASRVIAHVNGNHYVVVIGITATTITYMDPGAGADKQNQVETISKADFLKGWKGNATLESSQASVVSSQGTARILSAQETQKIRGAFFFFFIPAIIAAFTQIGAAVWAVLNGIGTIIAAASQLIGNALIGIQGAFQTLGQGIGYIGQSLWQGLSFAASSLFNAIGNVGSVLSQNIFGSVVKAGFGNSLFQNAVNIGVKFAAQKGLSALGVDPTITNLITAFVGGGNIGSFNAGFNAQTFIQNGVKNFALQGGQTALQQINPSASLSSLLSIVTSPLSDGIQSGNIGGSLVKIIPDIVKNVSAYGIDKLSKSLGLNSQISGLLSAPIMGALNAGFAGGVNVGANIISAINQGLTSGVVKYGLNFVGNSSPILGSLLSADIQNNIESAIGQNGLFQGIFNTLSNTVLNVFNVVGGAVQTVFQGVTSFGTVVQQKGLAGALQSLTTSIFSRSAQESIMSQGGITNILSLPRTSATLPSGQTAQEIKINADNSIYLDVSGNVSGFKKDGAIQEGSFGVYGDNFGLTAGQVEKEMQNDLKLNASVSNGQTDKITLKDSSGNVIFQADPEKPGQSIKIEGPTQNQSSASFNFWNTVFKLPVFALSLFVDQGVAYASQISSQPVVIAPSGDPTKILYALVNGFANPETNPNTPPDYIRNLEDDLVAAGNQQVQKGRDTMTSSVYENGNPLLLDIVSWLKEAQSSVMHLVNVFKIIRDFTARFKNNPQDQSRNIVAMGYSGGFIPLVEAVVSGHYNTKTLIGLGAATTSIAGLSFQDFQTFLGFIQAGLLGPAYNFISGVGSGIPSLVGTAVQRVVNVWGSNDELAKIGVAGKRSSIGGINTYNIEIIGADHYDYMRRSDEMNPEKADFNKRVSKFVTDLILVGDNDQDLNSFLVQTIATPDADGVWRFHP